MPVDKLGMSSVIIRIVDEGCDMGTPGSAGIDDSAPDLPRFPHPVVRRVALKAQVERHRGAQDADGQCRKRQPSLPAEGERCREDG
jgi:hypothetical protein